MQGEPATRARLASAPLIGWLVVALIAVGLRVWMWTFQAQSGAVQPGDPEEYYRAALHVLQGGYHDTGKWLRPPLYPAFLAICFSLFGVDLRAALLAQAILSGLAVPAFGWLALRLFRRVGVAMLAGLLAALCVPLASFGSVLFAEGLFVILVVAALAALDRAIEHGTLGAGLLAGLLLGAAALTRAVAVGFIPIAALLLLALAARPLTRTRGLRLLLGLLLGAAIVIGPWAIRNAAVHQRLILSDTNGGISMWYGVVRSDEEQQAGERQLWAVANLADRQSLALRWTVDAVLRDPAWFVGRMRFKIASLYLLQIRSYAVGDIITIDPRDNLVAMGAGEHPLGWAIQADLQYVVMMLAAIAGICFAPDRRRTLPVVAWVLFVTFMSAITIGHPRLRLPILAALIPCAAYGLALAWRWLRPGAQRQARRSGGTRPLAAMLVGWLLFVALIFSTRYATWARTWRDLQQADYLIAAENDASAEELLLRARAADPTNPLRTIGLADLAFRRGAYASALELYGDALQLEDRSLYAHAMRARIAAILQRPEIAYTEQRALAGYGRDSNEVYLWAWQRWADPPPTRVVPGDPSALGQYVGFAPATPDLTSGRWTLGDARIQLADRCGIVLLRLRGPSGRPVRVSIEGRAAVQELALTGAEQEVRLPTECPPGAPALPGGTGALVLDVAALDRQVATTVRIESPTGLLDLERAPWYVGVAVLEARIEEP